MKKFLTTCLALSVFALTGMVSVGSVSAEEAHEVTVSGDNLQEAYDSVKNTGGTIKVTEDVTLNSVLEIDQSDMEKEIVIDIAEGKKISTDGSYGITLKKGKLTITGKGSIEANNGMAVRTLGSENPTNGAIHSSLVIDSNVTLKGKIALSVSCVDTTNNVSYGQEILVKGKLESTEQTLNINGQIHNTDDAPIITIADGAMLTSTAEGAGAIYAAGYSNLTVNKATLNAVGYGIGIKAGNIKLNGTIVKVTGEANNNPDLNGNGINPSGAAIQIESNDDYSEGNISLAINGGNYESKNGLAMVEYGDESRVSSASVENVIFTSGDEGELALSVSEKFPTNFIKSGKFLVSGGTKSATIDPKYIAEGSTVGEDGTIVAPKTSTTTTVAGKGDEKNPKTGDNAIIYFMLAMLGLGVTGLTAKKVFSK